MELDMSVLNTNYRLEKKTGEQLVEIIKRPEAFGA